MVGSLATRQATNIGFSVSERDPPLLLEGDEYHVSTDGISRSFYSLENRDILATKELGVIALEEQYDLQMAQKSFIVRSGSYSIEKSEDHDSEVSRRQSKGIAPMGLPLFEFTLQEIDEGVLGSVGTGGTTWESSIAMALYLSSRPDLLQGNLVEVGCGVGFSGILNIVGPYSAGAEIHDSLLSMTLTDGNQAVLRQCRKNIKQVFSTLPPHVRVPRVYVRDLNWNDVLDPSTAPPKEGGYDTVLACDCAYRYEDAEALGLTLVRLLKHDASARIHLIAPCNRGAYDELLKFLREVCGMELQLNWIEMSRYRLKAGVRGITPNPDMKDSSFASKATVKFLHVVVSRNAGSSTHAKESELVDLD